VVKYLVSHAVSVRVAAVELETESGVYSAIADMHSDATSAQHLLLTKYLLASLRPKGDGCMGCSRWHRRQRRSSGRQEAAKKALKIALLRNIYVRSMSVRPRFIFSRIRN